MTEGALGIGLLGCGNIANIVASHSAGRRFRIAAVFDRDASRAAALARKTGARACGDMQELLAVDLDLVVEAASIEAVGAYGEAVLQTGRELVVLSVGALADEDLREALERCAREHGVRIRVPSGALFGLDNLKVGRIGAVDEVLLRTTKPPAALGLGAIGERTLLFRGPAAECIRRYPKNINVAVSLQLAAGRPVDVEVWADPAATANTHEVRARGAFGQVTIEVCNVPSPDNPATSYLAALSIVSLLDGAEEALVVGT